MLEEEIRYKAYPWRRFFAKFIDISLVLWVLPFAGLLVAPSFFLTVYLIDSGELLLRFLVLLVWMFVEALLLATWGSTPGKFLYNIKVRKSNGEKLTFMDALRRSLLAYFYGLACMIPYLILVAMVFGYYRLVKEGESYWDKGRSVVIHSKLGVIRWCFVWGLGTISVVLFLFGTFLA